MRNRSAKHYLGLLFITTCLLSQPGLAEERWYQVELLVFSHESGASAEEWKALPQLTYPPAARFLVYPARVAARRDAHSGNSRIDEFGRQIITQGDSAEDIPLRPSSQLAAGAADGSGETGMTEPAQSLPALPTPYIALPHQQRELHGKSSYMQRTGRFRTLFHETWVQPVQPEPDALPLVLDESGAMQDWPRLQGSVKLYLSRYLHVETNLWLNTPGDYLPGEWRMPAPPWGPSSLVVEMPEPPLEREPYFVSPAAAPSEPGTNLDPNDVGLAETGPVSPWRHAVLMQQSRRMRSNEIHYIDHPLLGVVVKLTPLDGQQLAAMAAAEAAADEAP
jgi:hypothetical protein